VASGAVLAPSGKFQETENKNKEHSVLTYDPTLNLIFIKAGEIKKYMVKKWDGKS
jgi:hypothetical protein